LAESLVVPVFGSAYSIPLLIAVYQFIPILFGMIVREKRLIINIIPKFAVIQMLIGYYSCATAPWGLFIVPFNAWFATTY
jgi:hypothetical protein